MVIIIRTARMRLGACVIVMAHTSEWLYGLRNAKLCVLHNTQSGLPSRRRAPCVFVVLPATEAKKIPG